MSKASPSKHALEADVTYCKSSFTLTFAVEILGVHAWQGFTNGRLELGNYQEAMRLSYQLYPGQSFDIDILIWPHVAKIWCGNKYCFVRTWQFLEERWLTFSIRHAFPVRVYRMIDHVATVTCAMGSGSLGANAKNDKSIEVFFPPFKFGERRYFGPVLQKEETIKHIVQDLLWSYVREYIPASHLDGIFDTPSNTTDIRHQDTILSKVQESILSKSQGVDDEDYSTEPEISFNKERKESKITKDKNKDKEKKKNLEINKEKYALSLSGDAILAGSGRIVSFETTGERPAEQSKVIVIISSNNLPAEDDHPIIFVNVETLNDIPIQEFRKARISQIFTRWTIGQEEHDSRKQAIKVSEIVRVNDHHAFPLRFSEASGITASFLDKPFKIQLYGVRQSKLIDNNAILFGNAKDDRIFGSTLPMPNAKTKNLTEEVPIAETRIDASSLTKAINGIVRGEFCLYPLKVSITDRSRDDSCTNDINGIKQPIKPDILIQPSVILQAQMTLEVSIGVVGCRPLFMAQSYLRLYCSASDTQATNALLKKIMDINENLIKTKEINELLTGFAIDTNDEVVFYVEGQRDGPILTVWEFTADFYPQMKPLFSCTDHHLDRIYGEMLSSATPFYVMKMLVPINTLLACPQVYVKPSLPLPTRSALLKIGWLVASKFKTAPFISEMPSTKELQSFRLELCVPPRPHREALLI